MRKMPWPTYLWPGLPQLWVYGSPRGLLVAVSAAALLNLALLSSFGWSELLEAEMRISVWLVVGVAWIGSAIFSATSARRQGNQEHSEERCVSFVAAGDYYLKGNWFQAERELGGLLQRDPRDLEARLMLATLLRRTGRLDEAKEQLEMLARFEGAGKWELERRRELELIDAA